MGIILLAVACVVFGVLFLFATPVGIVIGAIYFFITELFLLVSRLAQLASHRMHRAVNKSTLRFAPHLRLFK